MARNNQAIWNPQRKEVNTMLSQQPGNLEPSAKGGEYNA